MKHIFKYNKNIFVISYGKTSNKKIANPGEVIVQTYTFSEEQYRLANLGRKITMKEFFAADGTNCLDCPFSGNQFAAGTYAKNAKGLRITCYTHKFMQYSGFLSMLRSFDLNKVAYYDAAMAENIIKKSAGKFIRFGTYGEPSLMPIELIRDMAAVAKSHTGYTHQWNKPWAKEYGNYFMASVHDQLEAVIAQQQNYRSFIAKGINQQAAGIQCPASKESNYVSNCSKCSLCSGFLGKGKKDVIINLH
jgi:hypothetical protein